MIKKGINKKKAWAFSYDIKGRNKNKIKDKK